MRPRRRALPLHPRAGGNETSAPTALRRRGPMRFVTACGAVGRAAQVKGGERSPYHDAEGLRKCVLRRHMCGRGASAGGVTFRGLPGLVLVTRPPCVITTTLQFHPPSSPTSPLCTSTFPLCSPPLLHLTSPPPTTFFHLLEPPLPIYLVLLEVPSPARRICA